MLAKVHFYQGRAKKSRNKNKKKTTITEKHNKQVQSCLFSINTVSQYLDYITQCWYKIRQDAYC